MVSIEGKIIVYEGQNFIDYKGQNFTNFVSMRVRSS